MKKLFLRCMAVVMVAVMMSAGMPRVAMAAGESGTCGENSFMEYKNLEMKPTNNARYEANEAISWSCSGTVEPAGVWGNVFSWMNAFTFENVSLTLYERVEESNIYGGTDETRKKVKTLFSKNYNSVKKASFSERGTMYLEPGKYSIQLRADGEYVKETVFFVNQKTVVITTPPEKKNGYISVEHINENGTVVMNDTKILAPGTHTLYNEYNMPGYEKVGDLSQTVTVYNDGTASQSKVRFYVKWIEQTTDKVVNPVTAAPVTAAPVTPVPVTKPAFPIINEYCYIPDDGNNVRSGAGTNYSVLGQVNSGDWFVIYDYELGSTGKDWYKIYFNGQFGWISSGIVELNGNTEGTINGVPIGGGSFSDGQKPGAENNGSQEFTLRGFTIKRVATRSGPGTNYTDTGSYNKLTNEWVEIRSRAWDNRNDMWWVEVYVEGRWLWTPYARFDSATIRLEDIPINPDY